MGTSSSSSAALTYVLPSVFTITKPCATHEHAWPPPPFFSTATITATVKWQRFLWLQHRPEMFGETLSQTLHLCLGARVMVTHNLCVAHGLVNATRGIVEVRRHHRCWPEPINYRLLCCSACSGAADTM